MIIHWVQIQCLRIIRLSQTRLRKFVHTNPFLYCLQSPILFQVVRDLESRQIGDSKKPLDENSATHLIRKHTCLGIIKY